MGKKYCLPDSHDCKYELYTYHDADFKRKIYTEFVMHL